MILTLLFFVPEWPYLPLQPKGLGFYKCYFAKEMLNVGFRNFRLIFLKIIVFFSRTKTLFLYIELLELISALLKFRDKGERILAGLFLRSKFLWYIQNFQQVQKSFFLQLETHFSQFIDKYLIHHIKFQIVLCKFLILFSIV